MEDIILVGYGGHAKSVADAIERQGEYRIVGYTDTIEKESHYTYLGTDEVLDKYLENGVTNIAICIGYLGKGSLRKNLFSQLKDKGFNFPVIIDPSAVISSHVVIKEGAFVGKGAIINSGAEIGKMSIINSKALVEHDCKVGDFSHIAIATVLCGSVTVGESALVGANATVLQGKFVENGAIVPAGEVVR